VQDLIFQWADDKAKYKDIKDKVVALAQNRAALSKPVPMEVDCVKEEREQWGEYEEMGRYGWNDEDEKVEVDYVGESCLRCGGMGHYARECPTPKSKGKEGKGGGKTGGKGYKGFLDNKGYGKDGGYNGGYKGGYKAYGKDGVYKGKGKGDGGKGFAGTCWRCGEAGHRALRRLWEGFGPLQLWSWRSGRR
jgi:hypothetical protein